MIGLTEEEIKEAQREAGWYVNDNDYFGYTKPMGNVAKAQLKKVVEWGFQICTDHPDSYAVGIGRIDCPQCRQALLDEVKTKEVTMEQKVIHLEMTHLWDDGEVLGEVSNLTGELDMEFLQSVKELMREHKVNYLRLCWNHFSDGKIKSQS